MRMTCAAFAAVLLCGLSGCAPAYAEPLCIPLSTVASQLSAAGVKPDRVQMSSNLPAIRAYLVAAGLDTPEGSDMVGVLMIPVGDAVLVAIVESGECIKFTARLSADAHRKAYAAAFTFA